MGPSAPTPQGFVTVNQAAELLGVKPWDVRRLVEEGAVQSLVLIDRDSLTTLDRGTDKEKS